MSWMERVYGQPLFVIVASYYLAEVETNMHNSASSYTIVINGSQLDTGYVLIYFNYTIEAKDQLVY